MTDSLQSAWSRFRFSKHPDLRDDSKAYRMLQEAFFMGAAGVLMRVQEDVAGLDPEATAGQRGDAVLRALADMVTELGGMTRKSDPELRPLLVS